MAILSEFSLYKHGDFLPEGGFLLNGNHFQILVSIVLSATIRSDGPGEFSRLLKGCLATWSMNIHSSIGSKKEGLWGTDYAKKKQHIGTAVARLRFPGTCWRYLKIQDMFSNYKPARCSCPTPLSCSMLHGELVISRWLIGVIGVCIKTAQIVVSMVSGWETIEKT